MGNEHVKKYWESTNFLKKDYHKITSEKVVALLENQKSFNEALIDVNSEIESHKFLSIFRKLSFNVVSGVLQLLKSPYFIDFDPISEYTEPAKSIPLKTSVNYKLPTQFDDNSYQELSSILSYAISGELDNIILKEIRDNVGCIAYIDPSYSDFIPRLINMMVVIRHRCGYYPNWIVASSHLAESLIKVAEKFKSNINDTFSFNMRYSGDITWRDNKGIEIKQRLFENPLQNHNEMLMGYNGKESDVYKFRPKVILEPEINFEQIEEQDASNRKVMKVQFKSQFMTQKPENNRDFYSRIVVEEPD